MKHSMWGVVPAAGKGSRIQPLGFSKELLPVGSRREGAAERPRAVTEYLLERMIAAGANRVCFVISPEKSDILQYFGSEYGPATLAYVVQPEPLGLCDAVFRAQAVVAEADTLAVGLPDTVWFPPSALNELPDDRLSFLLFPVQRPELFDAVMLDAHGSVREIVVKQPGVGTNWIWGAFKMPGAIFHALGALWRERGCQDEYIGPLVNAYIAAGGHALGIKAGTGTFEGYRAALQLLAAGKADDQAPAVSHRWSLPGP